MNHTPGKWYEASTGNHQAQVGIMTRQEVIDTTERFEECGVCDHLHPSDYWGDCRNDDMRFQWDEIPEEKIRWLKN